MRNSGRAEHKWVFQWAAVLLLVASIPYLWGWLITPPGYEFLGLTHNIDDAAVYLSWMRQAADGHFFIRNLFTNEPQVGRQFNILFLMMGGIAGVLHLPLVWVFHFFRCMLAVVLVWSVWRFSALFLEDFRSRRVLIPMLCFSSGVGWLFGEAQPPTGPVDLWQPEAVTFLSAYLNPLFLAGLTLMVWAFYHLVLAERTGRVLHAVYAGVYLLLLGNIHTYDVITVAGIWLCYLIALTVVRRAVPLRALILSLICVPVAAPSAAYQFYLYTVDPVLHARANSPALSPPLCSYFAGYGLILVGAAAGMILCILSCMRQKAGRPLGSGKRLFLAVWSVVGFALPYIPVAQQRKLVMGLHVPLCMLCAYALSRLMADRPKWVAGFAAAVFLGFAAVGNIVFLACDTALLSKGRTVTHYVPYMSQDELRAMRYLRQNANTEDTVLAPPTFALFTPAFAGCQVYYGHWSETPGHDQKFAQWSRFIRGGISDSAKKAILDDAGAGFYVSVGSVTLPPASAVGSWLREVYGSGDVTVYRVIL